MVTSKTIREHFRAIVANLPEVLAQDADRARAALSEVLGPEITLRPAADGTYLEAEFGIEPLQAARLSGRVSEVMVAGACFGAYLEVRLG